MPKVNQKGNTQWESPQITPQQTATKVKGGAMPSNMDIVDSANARGTKRHDMKGQQLADVGVLPDSDRIVGDERVGIHNHDYLVKKNLEFGPEIHYNSLPPGMDIEDQENCDIRKMEMKAYKGGLGYSGDGWTASDQDSTLDMGRPSMTNYTGGKGT
jgi:hypothetical protein